MESGGRYAAAVIITGTLKAELALYAPNAEAPLSPPITATAPGVTFGGGHMACIRAPDDAKGYGSRAHHCHRRRRRRGSPSFRSTLRGAHAQPAHPRPPPPRLGGAPTPCRPH
ncbi:MAG: hypothetical protein IPI35_30395 [Deltaproteobacteria bacterium]|nr:hypothetical protein [Deltaproteobacteria bacterium]